MPGRSGNKSKSSPKSKKGKAIQRQKNGVVKPAAAEMVRAAGPVAEAPFEETPAPRPVKVLEYPYVAGELKRIGILAGILLAILIILSIILS